MSIIRRTGERNVQVFNSAGTIAAGDSVQFDEGGEVVVGATGVEILGVALEAATSSTTVSVDVASSGDTFLFPVETGTMADSEIGEEADLNSADGLTLTESNNDVVLTGWDGSNTAEAFGVFKNLAYSG